MNRNEILMDVLPSVYLSVQGRGVPASRTCIEMLMEQYPLPAIDKAADMYNEEYRWIEEEPDDVDDEFFKWVDKAWLLI